ncbi:mannose-6-phosphate isomerase [Actinomadura sp. NBRC 104425]|uniref:cupin domain-containing protein n=1 Tax=Actinomadura sp. NBRC 104425 TaxID=3032204 RepID=UPI0024A04F4D|nr:cupin domain-containing protein [Actinomadura sp. NBRC 104425]GLZ13370.1 mannose-6-phosphate isomerase [Actinomadura sp. NBRC 104425]
MTKDIETDVRARGTAAWHGRIEHIRGAELGTDTAQTSGMRRFEAVSGKTVGSRRLWMGRTHVAPATNSGDHHHGEAETAIYVVSGHPVFVFADGDAEVRVETEPGDYVFVPPYVPHREENPSPDEEAVVVIARSTQEGIVVNLPSLWAEVERPEPGPA